MDYILLLRGINVGGNHSVKMAELTVDLTNLGLDQVTSYINSGNLFFTSKKSKEKIQELLESYFSQSYAFPIPFIVLQHQSYLDEFSHLPEWWYQDHFRKNALFFLPSVTDNDIKQFMAELDRVQDECIHVGKFAIYWSIAKEEAYSQSFYHAKFIKTKLYKLVSIRNYKTSYYLAYQKKAK
ncbi:DUF1697 domain-containing protein [Streptococcus hongkongensis]|nr:hypothetical protein NC01_09500 [Streptococcus uberis]